VINVRIVQLEAQVTEQTYFSVVWKRGPHADETNCFSIESEKGVAQINQTFSKRSQIYSDAKTGKYLSKIVRRYNFFDCASVCLK
jgi:hypothetical protein